jgi:hypothetical protein
MSTLLEVTERAEGVIHNAFGLKGESFGFDLPSAMLVGIKIDENGNLADVNPELATHGDIYQLLDSVKPSLVKGFDALALVTCGWAAPIAEGKDEPETAPSQSPDRRRVRLFVCATRSEMASVLRFQDEAETPILDAGEARGPLAEAIADLMNRVSE